MQDKKEAKWADIKRWQDDIRVVEERVKLIYELKNEYEAKFYELKNKIGDYKEFMSKDEYN